MSTIVITCVVDQGRIQAR